MRLELLTEVALTCLGVTALFALLVVAPVLYGGAFCYLILARPKFGWRVALLKSIPPPAEQFTPDPDAEG